VCGLHHAAAHACRAALAERDRLLDARIELEQKTQRRGDDPLIGR
jgi:hypothetical protein